MSDHLMIVPILAVAWISLVYPLIGGCLAGVLLIFIATVCFGKCDRTFTLMTSGSVKTLRDAERSRKLQDRHQPTVGLAARLSPSPRDGGLVVDQ